MLTGAVGITLDENHSFKNYHSVLSPVDAKVENLDKKVVRKPYLNGLNQFDTYFCFFQFLDFQNTLKSSYVQFSTSKVVLNPIMTSWD